MHSRRCQMCLQVQEGACKSLTRRLHKETAQACNSGSLQAPFIGASFIVTRMQETMVECLGNAMFGRLLSHLLIASKMTCRSRCEGSCCRCRLFTNFEENVSKRFRSLMSEVAGSNLQRRNAALPNMQRAAHLKG